MSAAVEFATSKKPSNAASQQQHTEGTGAARPTQKASVAGESGMSLKDEIAAKMRSRIKNRATAEDLAAKEQREKHEQEAISQRIIEPHPSWADTSQTFRRVFDTEGVEVETDDVKKYQENVLQAALVVGEYVRSNGMPKNPEEVQLEVAGKHVAFADAMDCLTILGKMSITDSPNFTEAAMNRELDNDLVRFVAEKIADAQATGQEIDLAQIVLGLMGMAKAFVTEERFGEIMTGVTSDVHAAGADSLQEAVISTKADTLVVHGKDGRVITTLGNEEASAVLAQAALIQATGKAELSTQEQEILALANQLNATAVFLSRWKETMMVGGQVTFREDPITKILGPSVKQRPGCTSHNEIVAKVTADFPPVKAQDFVKRANKEGKTAQKKQPPVDQQKRVNMVGNSPIHRGEATTAPRDRIVGPNSSAKNQRQEQRPPEQGTSSKTGVSSGSGERKSSPARSPQARQAERPAGTQNRAAERGEAPRPAASQKREVVVGSVLRLAFRFADSRSLARTKNSRMVGGRVQSLRLSGIDRGKSRTVGVRKNGLNTLRMPGKIVRVGGSVQREQRIATPVTKARKAERKIVGVRKAEHRSAGTRNATGRTEQRVQTKVSGSIRSHERVQASVQNAQSRSQDRAQGKTTSSVQKSRMQDAAAAIADRTSPDSSHTKTVITSSRALLHEFQRLVKEHIYGQTEAVVVSAQESRQPLETFVELRDVQERALEANKRLAQTQPPAVITLDPGQALPTANRALYPMQYMQQQATLQLARSLATEGEFPVTDRAQASAAIHTMLTRLQQEAA